MSHIVHGLTFFFLLVAILALKSKMWWRAETQYWKMVQNIIQESPSYAPGLYAPLFAWYDENPPTWWETLGLWRKPRARMDADQLKKGK